MPYSPHKPKFRGCSIFIPNFARTHNSRTKLCRQNIGITPPKAPNLFEIWFGGPSGGFCFAKSGFILTTLVLMGLTPHSFSAETTNYQGFYPMPFVLTDEFRLRPRAAVTMTTCDMGEIYINSGTNELTVCGINNAKSKEVWEQVGNYVFPKSLAVRKISVGNDAVPDPPGAFNILGPLINGEQNEINIDLLNNTAVTPSLNSAGLTLRQDGLFNPAFPNLNVSTAIEFHVGTQGQVYDGRITYVVNDVLQGFGIFGGFNSLNIWVDRPTHRVGIGKFIPSERLDINGDIETNKIILDQDGTLGANPPADLKFTYSAGGNGYYAVYAP